MRTRLPAPTCPPRSRPPPRSLVVQECKKLLLVAERERGNVQACQLSSGEHPGAPRLPPPCGGLAARPPLCCRWRCSRRACCGSPLVFPGQWRPTPAASRCTHAFGASPSRHPPSPPPPPPPFYAAPGAGTWSLGRDFGLPYALTLGPYGTTLALTWKPGSQPAQAWLVALDSQPGVVAASWPLPGLQFPHDLTLLPAPLALTGAGAWGAGGGGGGVPAGQGCGPLPGAGRCSAPCPAARAARCPDARVLCACT